MKKLFKLIYKVIPYKKEFFSLLKFIWTPPRNIYMHLHFTGIIKVLIDKSTSFKINHFGYQIENEIFWEGLTNGWESDSIKLWIKLCKNSNITLDIGANTGVYSLVAETLNPKGKIFAFEPVQRVFEKLKKNISLNGFNTVAVAKAVSNTNGSAVIFDIPYEHVYSVTVNKNLSSPGIKTVETKIETITLDSFIEENNIPKIDLIKMDVETHEPEVLEGYKKYLPIHRPAILIEVLDDEIGNKIETAVKGLDYLFFNISEKGSIRLVPKITKSDHFNYLLCNKATAKELELI
jgi:FkbM family methyltransferase